MSTLPTNALFNDRYALQEEIGHGGMGRVVRAHDLLLNRDVAIKFLSKSELGTEGRTRLLHEAKAIAQLNHPNIVTVHDAGQFDNIPYIIMEYVEGTNLHDNPVREFSELLPITQQICRALDHAHQNGIIHRDLKPENVLVSQDGTVKLMDFGLARSLASRYTAEGSLVGTVFYLAPELALGKEFDGRADLYALGVMLYELTTGELPFMDTDPLAVISQHVHAPVVPPRARNEKIPPLLEDLILRLLNKGPEDRPASAGDVLELLSSPTILDLGVIPVRELSVLERIVHGRLVGREEELKQARNLWRKTLSGEGQLLLISGEPGIGKTRLLREMATHVEVSGGWALIGESRFGSRTPYDAFTQIVHQGLERANSNGIKIPESILADLLTLAPELRTIFKDIPSNPTLDPELEQHRLLENIASFVKILAEEVPLLLAVDDAHWSDSGTLAILQHLARRIRKQKVMLLITYREVELDEALPFHEAMLGLSREGIPIRLKLSRLTRDQTEDLLRTIFTQEITSPFLDAIYHETEGNPFFIEEVCKALVESGNIYYQDGQWHRPDTGELEIPQSIRVAIQTRVGRLPQQHQEVLRLASLLGREFEYEILLEASNTDEEVLINALESSEKAQLIQEIPGRKEVTFQFSHALFPATLAEGIRTLRRRKLHMLIAEAIEARRPENYEALALHYGEAGSNEKALVYFTKAGMRASSLYANQEAQGYFLSALDLVDDDLKRAELLTQLGIVLDRMGALGKAIDIWREGIELYLNHERLDQAADLYARCGRVSWERTDTPGNLSICQEGLQAIGEGVEGPGIAKLLAETGRAYFFNSQLKDVESYCRRAMQMAEKHQAIDVQTDALITLGLLFDYDAEMAVPLFEKAIELTEPAGFWSEASRAHNNLSVVLAYSLGNIKACREHLIRAAELSHSTGDISRELFYQSAALGYLVLTGEFQAAEVTLAELYELSKVAQDSMYANAVLRGIEADLLQYRGEREKAIILYQELHKFAKSAGDPQAITGSSIRLGELLIEAGKLEEAKSLIEEAIPFGDSGVYIGGVYPRSLLALINAIERDFATAHRYLQEAHDVYIQKKGPSRPVEYMYAAQRSSVMFPVAAISTSKRDLFRRWCGRANRSMLPCCRITPGAFEIEGNTSVRSAIILNMSASRPRTRQSTNRRILEAYGYRASPRYIRA